MDCNRAKEYIDMYADDMLSDAERAELERHIDVCAQCKQEFAHTMALKQSLSAMNDLAPPSGLAASAIKKAKKSKVPPIAFITAGVAAAAVLVVVMVSGMGGGIGAHRAEEFAYDAPAEEAAMEEMREAPEEAAADGLFEEEGAQMPKAADDVWEDSNAVAADEDVMCEAAEACGEASMEAEEPAAEEPAEECEEEALMPGGYMMLRSEQTDAVQAFDALIEVNNWEVERYDYAFEEVISFWMTEDIYEAFEHWIGEYELAVEGEYLPGAYIEVVVLK